MSDVAPTIANSLEEMLPLLAGKRLVLVDGRMRVGKTWQGERIAGDLFGTHVKGDCFFENCHGRESRSAKYAEVLDTEALRVRVLNALKRGPVVLDALCVLDVMRRLDLGEIDTAHVLISKIDPATARFTPGRTETAEAARRHFRRVVSGGTWEEVRDEYDHALLDDRVRLEDLEPEAPSRGWRDGFRWEALRYFKAARPHAVADVVLIRPEALPA